MKFLLSFLVGGPLGPFISTALSFLRVSLPIPIWTMVLAGGWLYFDRSSAIRDAVNEATTRLVAGAELDAAAAGLETERLLRERAEETSRGYKEASEFLEKEVSLARERKNRDDEEIRRLQNLPVNGSCTVDGDVLNLLRNR